MERLNEYDNQTMQNEEPIIQINDKTKVDQIMEERENPMQTKINRVSRVCEEIDEKKTKQILEQLQIQRKKMVSS
jgi:hypothetical protein